MFLQRPEAYQLFPFNQYESTTVWNVYRLYVCDMHTKFHLDQMKNSEENKSFQVYLYDIVVLFSFGHGGQNWYEQVELAESNHYTLSNNLI